MTVDVQVSGVPQIVAAHLAGICERDGDLNERAVLADARADGSPLHGYFEWDDGVAAEAHRLTQAAALIRRVRVTVITEPDATPIRVRGYIARRELSATAENLEPGSYLPIEQIAGQTAYETSLRESMRRDVLRLKRRYDNTDALLSVWQEVLGNDE